MNGATSGSVNLKPHPSTEAYSLTLPASQGSVTTCFKNDGTGNLSWSTYSKNVNTARYATDFSQSSGVFVQILDQFPTVNKINASNDSGNITYTTGSFYPPTCGYYNVSFTLYTATNGANAYFQAWTQCLNSLGANVSGYDNRFPLIVVNSPSYATISGFTSLFLTTTDRVFVSFQPNFNATMTGAKCLITISCVYSDDTMWVTVGPSYGFKYVGSDLMLKDYMSYLSYDKGSTVTTIDTTSAAAAGALGLRSFYSPVELKYYRIDINGSGKTYRFDLTTQTYDNFNTAHSNNPCLGHCPTNNRLYYSQPNASTTWYYINCAANTPGTPVTFTGLNIPSTYVTIKMQYDPVFDRIFLVPQSTPNTTWYYINCSTNTVSTYTGVLIAAATYGSGCYSPTEQRIYMAPFNNVGLTWHYIDCSTGIPTVGTYSGAGTTVGAGSYAYVSSVYSPFENRIYFIPHYFTSNSQFVYIDCYASKKGGTVANLINRHASRTMLQYGGSVFVPHMNRIYMTPNKQNAGANNWEYIDCSTGVVGIYTGLTTAYGGSEAYNAFYDHVNKKVYFDPWIGATLQTRLNFATPARSSSNFNNHFLAITY